MSIEPLIAELTAHVQQNAPDMLPVFEMYANEARFGRFWLDEPLRHIGKAQEILEIGGGMMLLACQLRKEGYSICALEPVGDGFSHFYRLQKLVMDYAGRLGICPQIMACKAEELDTKGRFHFIYSINVMEHVDDVRASLVNAHQALAEGGTYRFICPNYTFPLESHFGVPIIVNKRITWRLMRKRIENHNDLYDAAGLWASLNWITVSKVQAICRHSLGVTPVFDRSILITYINRALSDPIFRQRHSALICRCLRLLSRLGIIGLVRYIPARIMPVMDCTITRT